MRIGAKYIVQGASWPGNSIPTIRIEDDSYAMGPAAESHLRGHGDSRALPCHGKGDADGKGSWPAAKKTAKDPCECKASSCQPDKMRIGAAVTT